MTFHHISSAVALLILTAAATRTLAAEPDPVLVREFIYEEAPFPSCHASTIAETPTGLVAAWFGGLREGAADVGIWLARHDGKSWSAPVEVATGKNLDRKKGEPNRWPCWNPVLFQWPGKDAPLALFYKVGPSPSAWWGMLITSRDGGQTWSAPARLADGNLGPIKNKPVLLKDGRLLCPTSSEHAGWRVHFEWTDDQGQSWHKGEPINDGREFGAIQPSILTLGPKSLRILCRDRAAKGILTAASDDGGETWTALSRLDLPNPNSGIDAVTLADGRHLLVYNHTPRGRSPLNVALSEDGVKWRSVLALETEPGEYSYPAILQTADGKVHITYTWKRQRVRHVVVDPAKWTVED